MTWGGDEDLAGVLRESGRTEARARPFYIIVDNWSFRNCCVITVSTLQFSARKLLVS